jgi:hypothetical protein
LKEDKNPSVAIESLGASSININVYYWLDTFDKSVSGIKVKLEVTQKVLNALMDAGFYLPGDIVEMKNYSDSNFKVIS